MGDNDKRESLIERLFGRAAHSNPQVIKKPRAAMRARGEIITTGVDENLQLIGSDPFHSLSRTGLRVPTLATPNATSGGLDLRYLFLLGSYKVPDGIRVRIIGWRQYQTIGIDIGNPAAAHAHYIMEMEVTTPGWAFQDGNISWHLMRLRPGEVPQVIQPVTSSKNFVAGWVETGGCALLYEPGKVTFPAAHVDAAGRPDFYTFLSAYTPPNGGKPYGRILNPNSGTMYATASRFRDDSAWGSLDIPVEGACTIALFASVRQTNPATRAQPSYPANAVPPNAISAGYPPEEAFLRNFTTVTEPTTGPIYWRVGGSLIIAEEE